MKNTTLLFIILLTSSLSGLADPLPEQAPTISQISPNSLRLTWDGKNGKTYFLQSSSDLISWKQMPIIKSGKGFQLDYDFPITTDSVFYRLQYTDKASKSPMTADFDEDGISNWDEIRPGGTGTNPLVEDSNSDGIRDDGLLYAAKNNPDGAGLPASLDLGLIGRWDMEETSGTNIQDSSGNNWNGKMMNVLASEAVQRDPLGMVSQGLQFKGNNRAWVLLEKRTGKVADFSISIWFKMTKNSSLGRWRTLISAATEVSSTGLPSLKLGIANNIVQIYTTRGRQIWPSPHRLDDGQWHHLCYTRYNNNKGKIYIDNKDLGEKNLDYLKFNHHYGIYFLLGQNLIPYGLQLGNSLNSFEGSMDRLRFYNRALSANEVTALYHQDIDNDGLWDITELSTSYWNDINHNAIREDGEQAFKVSPFHRDDAMLDYDGDGLSSLTEQGIGTNIANPDTDGDLISDGWENKYGLNPLDAADATSDQDNDTLTAAEEYAISGTDPTKADTDGDQILDPDDHPPRWLSISRSLRYDYDDYGPQQPNAPKKLTTTATWPEVKPTTENLSTPIPFKQLHTSLGTKQTFPSTFPNTGIDTDLTARGEAATIPNPPCHHVSLNHRQIIVRAGTKTNYPRHYKAILMTERTINGVAQPVVSTELAITIPANSKQSNPQELTPAFTGVGTGTTTYRETLKQTLLPVDIVPDYNRDGKIDAADRGKVTGSNPWRFWDNDDNDHTVEERRVNGDDTPGRNIADQDGNDLKVDGVRDLIDFFPLHLDLKQALDLLPSDKYKYVLKHEVEAVKFFEFPAVILDGSDDAHAPHSYLRHIQYARNHKEEDLKLASAQGAELSIAFLNQAKNGKGIVLCETVKSTEQPLVLEILKKSDSSSVAEVKFCLKVTSVEDMYRRKYFSPNDPEGDSGGGYAIPASPDNWPDEDRNGKHFVFVHGYNVSSSQSQGWHAEMFKRLYWSGSNAMFTGITWVGNESQIGTTSLDYWDNVLNAFQTSKDVAAFVNALSGKKSIAAHSLGNMVVSSAIKDHGLSAENYFMIDAAVALEAYGFSQEDKMRPSSWSGYESRLWPTDWYKLFPTSDSRNKLTWKMRFGTFANAHNFYSSEEEILKNGEGTLPVPGAVRSWVYQEMSKGANFVTGGGLVHNGQGGWLFNFTNLTGGSYSDYNPNTRQYVMYSPAQANAIPDGHLKSAPFFKLFNNDNIINPKLGSAEAAVYDVRADILAEAIPAYSFAAGANPVSQFNPVDGPDRNQNMVDLKTDSNQWPVKANKREWFHSDIRDVGYLHNYQVFDKISKEIAELNQ